ncbi:hypothetical protein V8B97DRAFT_1946970, partial [Scleroderma yunnanense]
LLAVSTSPLVTHTSTQVRVSMSSTRHSASCLPAGLRLLGAQESTDILNTVEEHLVSTYLFILPDRVAMCMCGSRITISST